MKTRTVPAVLLLILLVSFFTAGCSSAEREFTTLQDFDKEDVTIGINLATEADFLVQEKLPNAKIVYLNSPADGTTAVLTGKVDAFSFDRTNLKAFERENSGLKLLDISLGPSEVRLGISLGEEELKEKANQFIREYVADGTADDMKRRWIDNAVYSMPELEAPKNPSGTLKVCTEAMCEPFSFVGDNGELLGYDIELATRFAYSMNMDVAISNMNWDALLPALQSGRAQILAAEIIAPPEEVLGLYLSDPYFYSDNAFIIKSDDNSRFFSGIRSDFSKTFITDHRWKLLVSGIGVTFLITGLSFLFGNLWGALLCIMAGSKKKAARSFARIYNIIMQGLPPVVLLFIMFYVILAGTDVPAMIVAVASFVLLEGDSLAGVFRVGLESVSKGQREGGKALGFTPWRLFRKVVLPQAARTALPLYGADFVSLLKGTSIVGFISIVDLTRASDIIRSRTYEAFFPMTATGVLYFIMVWVIIKLFRLIEKRIEPKERADVLKDIDKTGAACLASASFSRRNVTDEPAIRISGLCKSFGDLAVLKDVDASIRKGEVISVIGPSGCGKSTLIRCLNRIENADRGAVFINGTDIYGEDANTAEIRKSIGMVFQSYNLFEHMTNIENIMLGPVELKGMSRQEAYEKGMQYLTRVGLAEKALSYPDELSGGQKQRVAIARAIAMEPEIMLFDEPTSALDPNMVSEVLKVINELSDMGMTMIIVTHEMAFARKVSDRIFYMDENRIYETGTPEQIFDNPSGEKTRAFIFKIRTFTSVVSGQTSDLYRLQSGIQEFLTGQVLTQKRIHEVQLLCEEILYCRILNRIDGPVEIIMEYSGKEDAVTVLFRATGIEQDFLIDSDDLANAIITRLADELRCDDGIIRIVM